MNTDKKQDLGSGSVGSWMLKLAIPAVVAQVVNMLYNIVDRVYIGHIPVIGTDALTGIGLFAPILMLLNAFAMLVGSGGAPIAAIAMGRGDRERANRILGNCFSLLVGLAIILTAVFTINAEKLLWAFGASEATMPYALSYMRIYCAGSISVMLTLGLNPFVTTQGLALFSMMTTLIGAVCNIILDPIFIFVLGLGSSGAAIATVISQSVSAIWVLTFLMGRKTILKLSVRYMKLDPKIFLPALGLGLSTFVMMSTESLVSVSFNTSLVRYGGDMAVGAMTILTSVNQMVFLPIQGICMGGQPLISFNYGAGNKERVKKAFWLQFIASVSYACIGWLGVQFGANVIVGFFTSDPEFAAYSVWALRIFMMLIVTVGFQCSCQQAFLALGRAKISLFLACLRKILLLVPLIFIMPHILPEDPVRAVFLAEPVSDVIAAAVTTTVFMISFRKILSKM